MNSRWNILYRGPLSSCNYGCTYCPFAKTSNTITELQSDAAKLNLFIDWVETQSTQQIGILFTPWGEALIHKAYQQALVRLGAMPHVYRAAIQTNLSGSLDWLEKADRETVSLWCTFHPTETNLDKFINKVRQLSSMGVKHSVGVVGLKEHLPLIDQLRSALPPTTYLWVNAYKREANYYAESEVDFLTKIDQLFPINNQRHNSLGKPCKAGSSSFTVDGDGTARRCHFLHDPIGNIYTQDFASKLATQPIPCTAATCGCYIGYTNLPHLQLDTVYGDGILPRMV